LIKIYTLSDALQSKIVPNITILAFLTTVSKLTMRFNILPTVTILSLLQYGFAYRGMAGMDAQVLRQLSEKSSTAVEMIGDLQAGVTSQVGAEIRDCLLGDGSCVQAVSRVGAFKDYG
jgi:hypothetical protein